MNFSYKRGLKTAETKREICSVYGDDAITSPPLARSRFGNMNLNDAPRSGRPCKVYDDQIMASMKRKPHLTQKQITEKLGVGQKQAGAYLRAMGFTKI